MENNKDKNENVSKLMNT